MKCLRKKKQRLRPNRRHNKWQQLRRQWIIPRLFNKRMRWHRRLMNLTQMNTDWDILSMELINLLRQLFRPSTIGKVEMKLYTSLNNNVLTKSQWRQPKHLQKLLKTKKPNNLTRPRPLCKSKPHPRSKSPLSSTQNPSAGKMITRRKITRKMPSRTLTNSRTVRRTKSLKSTPSKTFSSRLREGFQTCITPYSPWVRTIGRLLR